MNNQYRAYFEKDGGWYIGYCPEFPGANGMGKTIEFCRQNLIEAIKLIIDDRLEDTKKSIPEDVIEELIYV